MVAYILLVLQWKDMGLFHYKNRRGEENLRDPLGQNWDFFNPLAQNGYFPPRTQNSIFLPSSDMFFSCDPPPDSFVQFYPPQTVFLADFSPLGTVFLSILPPSTLGQLFSHILPPSDSFFYHLASDSLFWQFYPPQTIFRKCYPPLTHFLETPLRLGDLTPSDKKAIYSPPPVFLMK